MLIRICTVLLLFAAALTAHAGLVIQGSRIIYEEARGEATVQMQYVGDAPTLLQVWMETEEGTGRAPGEGEVPFIMMPAVTRLDPGSGQTVRILHIGEGLPADRESMFWFNTLEVPPAPTAQLAAGEAFMQFSIRGQFKFFYRPKGLTPVPEKAPEMLQFSLAEADAEGRVQLRVRNASPYHVTFSSLKLLPAGAEKDAGALLHFGHDAPGERMVAPMGELVLAMDWNTLSAGAPVPEGAEVEFAIINDAGGVQTRRQRLE